MNRFTKGFTLIELLIIAVLLGILTSIALSGVQHLQQSQQLRNASLSLWSHLALARTEALNRGVPVILAAVDGQWTAGWRVFPDLNRNGQQDPNESTLQQHAALEAGVFIRGNSPVRHYIRYTPDGRTKLQGGAFQAGTLFICNDNGKHPMRQLIISATGRVRSGQTAPSPC